MLTIPRRTPVTPDGLVGRSVQRMWCGLCGIVHIEAIAEDKRAMRKGMKCIFPCTESMLGYVSFRVACPREVDSDGGHSPVFHPPATRLVRLRVQSRQTR